MKTLWQSLREKAKKKQEVSLLDNLSISNDEVALLAKRLEFFLPEFRSAFPIYEQITYTALYSLLFASILTTNIQEDFLFFIKIFIKEFFLVFLTAQPMFLTVDGLREHFKQLSIWQVCIRVCAITAVFAVIAKFFVALVWSLLFGGYNLVADLPYLLLIHVIPCLIVAILFLNFFLSRHRELASVSDAFELKLASQNELFNARMSPHFFFNTINGLVSMVETRPDKAVEMLSNISTLFRASFNESDEISFEEEVQLCQVFLSIDEMRFHGKLYVEWELPDEDELYDMVITALSLQSVLEKLFYHVVEMTTQAIHVKIVTTWIQHVVKIKIIVELPSKTLLVKHDLYHQMNFDIQAQRLKYYFGDDSSINTLINNHQIEVTISYPLYDPNISLMALDDVSTDIFA